MSIFYVGSSTAAHQVEGNNIYSDDWALEHMRYTDFYEPSGDAVDHYHRYREDIQLMKKAGLNAYRFSIEWARIEPCEGEFHEEEINHYLDVIQFAKENGIEPMITLHHFTSPKWLISLGGWENKKVIEYFKRYTHYVISKIGPFVNYVFTINEANMGIQVAAIAKRYKVQMMAQMKKKKQSIAQEGQVQVGLNLSSMLKRMRAKGIECKEIFGVKNPQVFVSMRSKKGDRYVCLAHQAAREEIKRLFPHIQVGITLSLHDIQAVDNGKKRAIQEWNDEFTHYLPYLKEDDVFGLQNYSRSLIGKNGQLPNPENSILTQMGYEYYPEGLEHVARRVYQELKKPIMITENGIATDDDALRCKFIKEALEGVKNAKEDLPLLGYLHWSFIDNFEWQKGYSMRFGLVSVDRNTMERTPKESLYLLGNYTKILNEN